jgi:hypothetical protein
MERYEIYAVSNGELVSLEPLATINATDALSAYMSFNPGRGQLVACFSLPATPFAKYYVHDTNVRRPCGLAKHGQEKDEFKRHPVQGTSVALPEID